MIYITCLANGHSETWMMKECSLEAVECTRVISVALVQTRIKVQCLSTREFYHLQLKLHSRMIRSLQRTSSDCHCGSAQMSQMALTGILR